MVCGYSDTKVHTNAKRLYQVVVNLADNRYSSTRPERFTDTLHANWGVIIYLVDNERSHLAGTGASIGADVTKNAIEIRIPWTLIGGTPSGPSFYLRLSLITARGWSHYDKNEGGAWDIGREDVSDALDAMTTAGPNTWNDVKDSVVNYYVDVYLTITQPYYQVPEPGILVAVATVGSASGFTACLLKKSRG